MKVDINRKERRRRKPRFSWIKGLKSRAVWETVRWVLILGPRLVQFIEWLRH